MARSLNKALIIGNLGNDPEIRTTGSGTKVANLSIATSRQWNDRNGQQQEKTEWHRIVAWDKLAEIAERFLSKGDRVYIEGEIEYRSYEDKDGVTKYSTEIRARELMMLGGREGGAESGGRGSSAPARQGSSGGNRGSSRAPAPAASNYDDFAGGDFPEDDDLPF